MKTGTILDIKEFAIFDGPGIRQTVFFKGCPLRCNWCHNPEGLQMQPELMISQASCTHCGKCADMCEISATARHEPTALSGPCPPDDLTNDLSGTSTHGAAYRPITCRLCGDCIPACPLNLRHIVGETLTSDELVERIRKNSDYYAKAGGGVTFSGGEPLMQAEFLLEVLGQLPDLHRAVETSGYCSPEVFGKVVRMLDFVMMDIKIFDSALHKKYTGVQNEVILQNAKLLCEGETPFVIRIPVIPEVNDNEDNYRQTASFLAGARALQKVELLPYHKTAGAKYSMLHKNYAPMFDTEKEPWISTDIFREYGIRSEKL